MDDTILTAALNYASWGWPVFPCNPETKAPMCRHGNKDATTDPKTVEILFKNKPAAMIGVATGTKVGAFVLDINPPDGMDVVECAMKVIEYIEFNAVTYQYATPNGFHLWFKTPEGVVVRNRGKLLDGLIDCVRGEGGYVIVPPSRNAKGKSYRGAVQDRPDLMKMAPKKLLELVIK